MSIEKLITNEVDTLVNLMAELDETYDALREVVEVDESLLERLKSDRDYYKLFTGEEFVTITNSLNRQIKDLTEKIESFHRTLSRNRKAWDEFQTSKQQLERDGADLKEKNELIHGACLVVTDRGISTGFYNAEHDTVFMAVPHFHKILGYKQ